MFTRPSWEPPTLSISLVRSLPRILVRRLLQASTPQLPLQQGDRQQRRVPLIQVVKPLPVTECLQDAHSADAQHRLLPQPIVSVPTISLVAQFDQNSCCGPRGT